MGVDTASTATASVPARAEPPAPEAPEIAPQADLPSTLSPVELGGSSSRHFAVITAGAVVVLAVLVIWMAANPNHRGHSVDIDVVVKLAVATVAAASCFVFGRRAEPELRLAWMWIASFATIWAIGQAFLTGYNFSRNGAIPFPSLADAAFLVSLPLAAIGLLLFPLVPRDGSCAPACPSTV